MAKLSTTRAGAKQQGEKFYQTNIHCKRGHTSKRRTRSGRCMNCEYEDYQRRLGQENDTETTLAIRAKRLKLYKLVNPQYEEKRRRDRMLHRQLCIDRRPPWLRRAERDEMAALYQSAKEQGQIVDHVIPLCPSLGGIVGLHVPSNLAICPSLDNGKKGRRLELSPQQELDAIANGKAVRWEDAPKGKQVNWQPYVIEALAPFFELIAGTMPLTWTVSALIKRATDIPPLTCLIRSICGEPISSRRLSNFLAGNTGLVSGGRLVTLVHRGNRGKIWRIDCI